MFQVDLTTYASDALEDAMNLAQTKALNSYTFSDCLNYLNYTWRDIYDRLSCIDEGYYGVNVKLKSKLTKLPSVVKNSIQVYAAQAPNGFNRYLYREASNTDLEASGTFKISGNDLYCADATRTSIWLYYVPACPMIFFTHHNRDPKLYEDDVEPVRNNIYNLFKLVGKKSDGSFIDITTCSRADIISVTSWYMEHRGTGEQEDITEKLIASELSDNTDGIWNICYISCNYPYIFISYEHSITKEHVSGFFSKDMSFNLYNPFSFTGHNSDVEYLVCNWNDKTGMGVIIKDYNDSFKKKNDSGEYETLYRCKELGWTPDTKLTYPCPEMYRYLVARLADKFSALNESNIMGVQKELAESHYAFEAYVHKNKSAFFRINNVNPATFGDLL